MSVHHVSRARCEAGGVISWMSDEDAVVENRNKGVASDQPGGSATRRAAMRV